MTKAGVLKSSTGLQPTSAGDDRAGGEWQDPGAGRPLCRLEGATGRVSHYRSADLDAAIAWAARSPTALHGVVEVRPMMDKTLTETLGLEATREPIGKERNMRKFIVFNHVSLDGYFTD